MCLHLTSSVEWCVCRRRTRRFWKASWVNFTSESTRLSVYLKYCKLGCWHTYPSWAWFFLHGFPCLFMDFERSRLWILKYTQSKVVRECSAARRSKTCTLDKKIMKYADVSGAWLGLVGRHAKIVWALNLVSTKFIIHFLLNLVCQGYSTFGHVASRSEVLFKLLFLVPPQMKLFVNTNQINTGAWIFCFRWYLTRLATARCAGLTKVLVCISMYVGSYYVLNLVRYASQNPGYNLHATVA